MRVPIMPVSQYSRAQVFFCFPPVICEPRLLYSMSFGFPHSAHIGAYSLGQGWSTHEISSLLWRWG